VALAIGWRAFGARRGGVDVLGEGSKGEMQGPVWDFLDGTDGNWNFLS